MTGSHNSHMHSHIVFMKKHYHLHRHILYLRNHPTPTVNNLLQNFDYAKSIQLLLFNKTSILFRPCVKISEQYLEYYAENSLFNLKGQNRRLQKLEFGLK